MVNRNLPGQPAERRSCLAPRSAEGDDLFFEVLSLGYPVSDAADRACYSRTLVYRWRRQDRDFAARWREALLVSLDTAREEAMRRVFDGVEEPVFQKGAIVGTRRKFSERLLIEWLKHGRRWITISE
ncbi:MAG: hypothetical protein KJS87_06185 [Alphaproteobacteria bacterium]|nr:hypothetical protein [Alphaproteobacteria bacterium]